MNETVFQNSGSVNTLLGSINRLSSFLPLKYLVNKTTTLNYKYSVIPDVAPDAPPKLQYFGLGIKGFYCTSDGTISHVKYNPDCRNMDLYSPIPIRVVPLADDLAWEERKMYRMRVVTSINGAQYVCYYLKKIVWDPDSVQLIEKHTDGSETEYTLDSSYLTPEVPTSAQTGGGELTSATRIIVRALGNCNVSMDELANTVSLFDLNYATISEIGFYTGCDVYLDESGILMPDVPVESDDLVDGAESIEAAYVQLAKHKTQLPITLENEGSSLNATISFEESSSIAVV